MSCFLEKSIKNEADRAKGMYSINVYWSIAEDFLLKTAVNQRQSQNCWCF